MIMLIDDVRRIISRQILTSIVWFHLIKKKNWINKRKKKHKTSTTRNLKKRHKTAILVNKLFYENFNMNFIENIYSFIIFL